MTKVIVLENLRFMPKVIMRGVSPVSQEEAQAWGEERKAAKVYYYPPTKTAYAPVEEK